MSDKKIIEVVKWTALKRQVQESNEAFFHLIDPIAKLLETTKKDYVYIMDFKFGEKFIDNGQMSALLGNNINQYEIVIDPTIQGYSSLGDGVKQTFIKDCERNTDHPLSLVLENYIEIFTTHNSGDKAIGSYSFPLNTIKVGQLFGVWGSLDIVSDKTEKKKENWFGVGGKQCIIPIFPNSVDSTPDRSYKRFIQKLFGVKENFSVGDLITGIQMKVNQLDENWKVRIVIFPEHYFSHSKEEIGTKISDHKICLQNYLFKVGWKQAEMLRNVLWKNKEVVALVGQKKDNYTYQFYSHVLDVIEGNAYLLKLIDTKDDVLWKVYMHIVNEFKQHDWNTKQKLIEYTYPYIFHYSKITTCNWGVVLAHSPAENVAIPECDTRGSVGYYTDIFNIDFKKLFTNEPYVKLNWYEKKEDNNNFFLKYLKTDRRLSEVMILEDSSNLKDKLVKLTKPPSIFNHHFIAIEKTNKFAHLPVLNAIELTTEPKNDIFIVAVQHLLETTGSLIEAILRQKISPKNIYILGKVYSTNKETQDALTELGVNVQIATEPAAPGTYAETLNEDVKNMWQQVSEKLTPNSIAIVLDDGGYNIKNIPDDVLKNYKVFGIEQTMSGIKLLNKNFKNLPIISVAGSAAKTIIEPPIVSEAVLIRLGKVIHDINPKRIGIIGYGNIGYAVAKKFAHTYSIEACDTKKELFLNPLDGVSYSKDLNKTFNNCDLIIGATGEDISLAHYEKWLRNINNDKTLISVSSGDVEFRSLLKNAKHHLLPVASSLQTLEITTTNGKKINVLRGGMVANFTGEPDSSPSHIIQVTRGLLLSAVFQILDKSKTLEKHKGIVKLDPALQKKIVTAWFKDQPQRRADYSDEVLEGFQNEDWIAQRSEGI